MSGGLVERDDTVWVEVADVDAMPPFLVSVVSPGDHWLYASSAGGLTAGRIDADHSLFPYLTDDRLHRAHQDQGPWTCLRAQAPDGAEVTWEPFRPRNDGSVRRHMLKSVAGDRLVFEEQHLALGLTFQYRWAFSERFGFVRTATLSRNGGDAPLVVEVVDGLQGLLPANAPLPLVQAASCLVDAYSRAEWVPDGGLALFTLEALPTDRAEPAESLRATVAWCVGLEASAVLLSREQLDEVTRGRAPRHEPLVTGRPGAFLVAATVVLPPDGSHTWHVVADVGRSHADVTALCRRAEVAPLLAAEVAASTAALDGILADVDGLQQTGDAVLDAHLRASALFNAMRGGLPVDEHRVSIARFSTFVGTRNRRCRERHAAWFAEREGRCLERSALVFEAEATGDADLARLAHEVLPLWFGRRHGDPSRPWNRFSIRVAEPDGNRRVAWEGNWRDVFQNWEALLHAYPEFLEGAVAAFVNASTRDGHNPYRISSEGIDWEKPDPHDPWSNLGYWGDHQVSYLTRLIEASLRHHPGRLSALLDREIFSYADVPYRLRPYAALVADPRDSIEFDVAAQGAVDDRVARTGQDGRLVPDGDGVLHVNLAEKLVVPVLAALCKLVPGGGLWLCTQRPEWNDANNALAGFGVSVVTAAWLRRHLRLLRGLFAEDGRSVRLTAPVAEWLDTVRDVLWADRGLGDQVDDRDRRRVLDALGKTYGHYRARVYAEDEVSWSEQPLSTMVALCDLGVLWLDHALSAARRDDGLFDGYDLLGLGNDTASLERLYPMLEGQVAVLSSGVLTAAEAADLVEHLYDGPLYRPDVDSFLLYPDRALPSFLDKNRVPVAALSVPLVVALLDAGDERLVLQDDSGAVRFAPDLRNAGDVAAVLDALGAREPDRTAVADLWEATFHHHAFTGRSGTMYAYEGLGSVYWHMVGKLLVAVQEAWSDAVRHGAPDHARLARLYHRVRSGLGFRRCAAEFGAIPTDPYSHTPRGRGAQQPGMTGLVKEMLLARRGELGVEVDGGRLAFEPVLLDPAELVDVPTRWTIPGAVRPARVVEVPAGGTAFLVCGVPVIYQPADGTSIEVHLGHEVRRFDGNRLDEATSQLIFRRVGEVTRIVAALPLPRKRP